MRPLTPTYLIAVEDSEYKYDLLPDGLWILLGTVTANEISFDVEPFFKKIDRIKKDVCWPVFGYEPQWAATPQESFYSLLKANGLSDFKKLLILKPI